MSDVNKMTEFKTEATFLKVDEGLGLIFGFAIVCTENGEEYTDLHGDFIPEDAMLEAATDFMKSRRVACTMHERDASGGIVQDGGVVHSFPLTADIAKALEIETTRTGWLVALAPDNPETLQKAREGKFAGFSIGGARIEDIEEEV